MFIGSSDYCNGCRYRSKQQNLSIKGPLNQLNVDGLLKTTTLWLKNMCVYVCNTGYVYMHNCLHVSVGLIPMYKSECSVYMNAK